MTTPLDTPAISPSASISDLIHRHAEVMKQLRMGPVILTNRDRPTAILVSPDHWNTLVEYVDDLECGLAALQTQLAVSKGEDEFGQLTPAEIEEWLGDNELSD